MKIPSSSSVLLATLAISSSSSSLAAPASDAPQAEAGMSTSHSNRHLSRFHHSGSAARGLRAADMDLEQRANSHKRSMIENNVEERGVPVLDDLCSELDLTGKVCDLVSSTIAGMLLKTSENIKVNPEDTSVLQNGGPNNASATGASAPPGAPAPLSGVSTPSDTAGAVAGTAGNITAPIAGGVIEARQETAAPSGSPAPSGAPSPSAGAPASSAGAPAPSAGAPSPLAGAPAPPAVVGGVIGKTPVAGKLNARQEPAADSPSSSTASSDSPASSALPTQSIGAADLDGSSTSTLASTSTSLAAPSQSVTARDFEPTSSSVAASSSLVVPSSTPSAAAEDIGDSSTSSTLSASYSSTAATPQASPLMPNAPPSTPNMPRS